MKWNDVRKIYPNQFVKIQVLDYHMDKNTEYIDDMTVINAI
ncbi:hypothetical protein SDC9_150796 [bioreactor metagenome]|uniref:Uncharacterized protein n=1 Tax=bioreactor metagenome TaxID=1076179 RepID=A0A645ENH2_9ZZZZ